MKYIYILENEAKFRDEMIESILKIDPQMGIRFFESLDEFAVWIKLLVHEGPSALPKGGQRAPQTPEVDDPGPSQLRLVISKNEFLGDKHMALIRKTQDLFIRKGACTPEEPTSLVITSFDSSDFDIKLVEDRIINNVLFKPFDKLILQQHLTFAIGGRHPASQYNVHNMKTSAIIEMLKEVQIEALSDVGFISLSNRPIAPGSLAKYYSPAFISLKEKSMMSICLRCDPHPEIKNFYRCVFTYMAADPFQISNLRKEVRKKDAVTFDYSWIKNPANEASQMLSLGAQAAPPPKEVCHIGLITTDETLAHGFKLSLEKRFHNVQVYVYGSLPQFVYAVDPQKAEKDKKKIDPANKVAVPKSFHALFADNSFFEDNFTERWQNVMETVTTKMPAPKGNASGKTELFMLSQRPFSDSEERALGQVVKDIFFLPIDPIYLSKKMMLFMPQLNPSEDLSILTTSALHIAKVASPIEISEFSEAGLVIKYYRAMSVGSFREFVLWLPSSHEMDLPELIATCNYTEVSSGDKEVYLNHFVFFGMHDHYLKHIRRWMLQNYVLAKESQSA